MIGLILYPNKPTEFFLDVCVTLEVYITLPNIFYCWLQHFSYVTLQHVLIVQKKRDEGREDSFSVNDESIS